MDTTIQIQPVIFYPTTATFVHIADTYVHLHAQTADCQVTFLDSGYNPIVSSAQRYHIDTGVYAGWLGDDQYILDAVISGLSLTIAS